MTNSDYFDAIKAGDLVTVQQMIEREPALINAKSGVSAVLIACYYQEPQIAQLLIDRGAQLDIFDAAATGQLDRIKELLNQKPDLVNSYANDGFQPLGLAAYFGHPAVAAELVARGADVSSPSHNAQMVQPLHSAVASRQLEITRLLLKAGAEVNAAQQDGYTPLHEAAQDGNIEIIKLLLEYGAKLDVRLTDGSTPFDLATVKGHTEAAKLLQ